MKILFLSVYLYILGLILDIASSLLGSAARLRAKSERPFSDMRIRILGRVCERLYESFYRREIRIRQLLSENGSAPFPRISGNQ